MSSEFMAWMTVVMLIIVIAWMAKQRRDDRDEIKRLWDAEDIRRGGIPDQSTSSCDECGIDTNFGVHLCYRCQRAILQSGDH